MPTKQIPAALILRRPGGRPRAAARYPPGPARRHRAPTGRKVRLASTIIYRFEQGRVAEEWEIFDKLGMYRQLGVPPPAG